MGVVDVDDRIGLLCRLDDLRQPGDVPVHAENAIGQDQYRSIRPTGRSFW